jgi:predicted PurR-regulated permease PerM
MITLIILFILYIYLRLRYIKAGRIIFCLFLLIELCMIITDCMLWVYEHIFYFVFYALILASFIYGVKRMIKKRSIKHASI